MKILVPIDDRDYSNESLSFVARRTPLFGNNPEIELFYVDKNWPEGKSTDSESQFRDGAKDVFDLAKTHFAEGSYNITCRAAGGKPAKSIATEANRGGFDLIVMATRGRSRLMTILSGSVTFELLEHTACPVLILRGETNLSLERMRVGVCVDGSNFGCAVTKILLQNIQMLGKSPKINLLSVVPPLDSSTRAKLSDDQIEKHLLEAFEQSTGEVKKLFDEAGIAFEPVPLQGSPASAIVQASNERALELLVMGSHGEGARMGAIMGSVATDVAAEACLPLLIIRDKTLRPREKH